MKATTTKIPSTLTELLDKVIALQSAYAELRDEIDCLERANAELRESKARLESECAHLEAELVTARASGGDSLCDSDEERTYYLSGRGIYHLPSCEYVPRYRPIEISRREAFDGAYRPCAFCVTKTARSVA